MDVYDHGLDRRPSVANHMIIERRWAMPNARTFSIKPITELIERHVRGHSIDPFANLSRVARVTNDLNPDYHCDYALDALDFLRMQGAGSVDTVLFDPPYSPRQVSECYKKMGRSVNMTTTQASFWGNAKREIARVSKGKVLTFGWNSGGIGKKYGFEIIEILLVAHGGWHNDTICVVEQQKGNLECHT
jgi:hypothetical protein